jgi:hypothetical protein
MLAEDMATSVSGLLRVLIKDAYDRLAEKFGRHHLDQSQRGSV